MNRNQNAAVVLATLCGLCAAAQAQEFVNGDFATGDFTGWTIVPTANGVTRVQEVLQFELVQGQPQVNAAHFSVGQEVSVIGEQAGIEMTQEMNLVAGTAYNFGFNWAAIRYSGSANLEGGVFSLIVDGVPLETQAAGSTSSTLWHYGRIDQQFIPSTTGVHTVGVRITRPYTVGAGGAVALNLRQIVGNFTPSSSGGTCYANCDGSTVEPVLNVDDFTCFINEFAAAQGLPHEQQVSSYANCDGSQTAPALNVDDFTCFINQYAQGCP
jgi:hypothetical protein